MTLALPSANIAFVLLALLIGSAITWVHQRGTRLASTAALTAMQEKRDDLVRDYNEVFSKYESLIAEHNLLKLERVSLLTRADAEREALGRERTAFDDQRVRLEQTFRAIGAEVLDANAKKVSEIARGVLAEQQATARGELNVRALAVEKLVEPVTATLGKLDEQIRGIETKRAGAYEELRTRVEALGASDLQLKTSADELSRSTTQLMQALQSSGSRGRWGEIALRRIVELAGMLQHCDFDEQVTISGQHGNERPDMLVFIPGDRFVVVDAKVPLAAYLDAVDAGDDTTRNAKLKGHVRAVRAHVAELSRRGYLRHDQRTPDLKLMFVPSEGALTAALIEDPEIFEDAITSGICIASPSTLIAMLRMMSLGWRQQSIEENARKIAELGSELYERIGKVAELMGKVGKSLGTTVSNYNDLVASTEGRLIVTGRKLQELGAVPAAETLTKLAPIERTVRPVMLEHRTEVSQLTAMPTIHGG